MSTDGTRRTRRSSEDIRALLIDSARELFLSQGFEATTTKQISERAGVAEQLLFTNFGSKADLFETAVLAPIADFVSDYAASWRNAAEAAPQQRVDDFVRGLYEIVQRNRSVLLSALAGDQRGFLDRLAGTLQGLRGVSDLEDYEDVDPPAALAAALGMVLGVALVDDLLFPRNSRRPNRDRLITEMEKLILHGTTGRAGAV